jgi:glycosyltransferase involved in cell wall biosynthesis
MKVLQLIPELEVGGTERGTVELAEGLIRRGHQALVISSGGKMVALLESCGARHVTLPVGSKSPWTMWRMVKEISKWITKEKVDLVHARSRVPGLIGFLACRRSGVPFVTTCHGYYRQNVFGTCMGWGRRVIVSSSAIARHMLEDFEVSEERLRLIPRGVDLEAFPYRSPLTRTAQEKTVGMIGRITPLKGHVDFIRAISRVLRVFPTVRVVIVGEAPPGKKYRQNLELLVRRLGLHQTVEFRETTQDVPATLAELDLLILASRTPEAFGVT